MSTPTRPFGRKQLPSPLPDAKVSYEPLLKRELANRLGIICATSLTFTSLVALISTFDVQQGPPLGLLGHLVAIMLMALATLAVGAGPSLLLRGRAVSGTEALSPTRAGTLISLASSPRTWRTLTYFGASGFLLALLQVAFVNMTEWEDSRLSIMSPTRRNPYRLNERFIYLAFFNMSLGLIFAIRDVVRDRCIPKWPRPGDDRDAGIVLPTSPSALEALLAALNRKALLSTTLITAIHIVTFPFSYHLCRMFMLPILRNLPAISWLTRPMLHGCGRTWVVDVSWSRMVGLGFKTSLTWELVESSFDYWSAKPITTSPKAQNPNHALIAGLHSQDRYFKHHAYLELTTLAASSETGSASRRTALFIDTKTSPTLWSALSRELLMTLGRDYQLLLRRGKPAPPAPAPAPRPAPLVPRTPKTPSTPLLRQPILKSSPRALFDRFASEGSATTQPSTPAKSHDEHADVPSVFLPSTPATPSVEKKDIVKVVPPKAATPQLVQRLQAGRNSAIIRILGWVEGKLPADWQVKRWWTEVNLEVVARSCIPERELDIAGIDALSHLVASSLTEDTLGTVQRDIPRVLEALLSFLGEAEAYKAELESKLPVPNGDGGALVVQATQDVARAVEVVQPLIIALRTGIGLIAKTFGDRLTVYKFPAPTAKRLQTFMDYL